MVKGGKEKEVEREHMNMEKASRKLYRDRVKWGMRSVLILRRAAQMIEDDLRMRARRQV